MHIKFLRDVRGCYGRVFKKGEIHEYKPWGHEWHNKSEAQRLNEGIFVECHGQGEFDVFYPADVVVISKCGS